VQIPILSIGSSGSVTANLGGEQINLQQNGSILGIVGYVPGNGTVTIDTTASQTLDVTVTWSAASSSNALTLLHSVLEMVN
jgi:hypothetical protein